MEKRIKFTYTFDLWQFGSGYILICVNIIWGLMLNEIAINRMIFSNNWHISNKKDALTKNSYTTIFDND